MHYKESLKIKLMELTVGTRVDHERYGEGIVSKVHLGTCEIFFEKAGKMSISKTSDELTVVEKTEVDNPININLDANELASVIENVLDKYGLQAGNVDLGEKWKSGKLILQPEDPELKSKEIPIETFFHKIVMVRDRLRVLEQNINNSKNLSDAEKVDMQQYITRAYGSLTTFNLLFRDKEDYFKGAGRKE